MTEVKEKVLLSFHGDPKVKEMFLERVKAHQKADEIIQGYGYWQDGKGCAVGCTIHGKTHSDYEKELGLPTWLAHLEDRIFENLPVKDAKKWPLSFLKAIPVGVDLEPVKFKFLSWLLIDEKDGIINLTKDADIKASVKIIGSLLATEAKRPLTQAEVAEGDSAARDARDAWAARDARAARAARDAWDAWAARAARDAWAAWDAWDARAKKSADKLLVLLRATGR